MENAKIRDLRIDFLRIISAIAVVMIHANHPIETAYGTSSAEYVFSYIFETISRFAVPVFLMISGAFMLDENKKITMKDIYLKYFLNTAIVLIIWSVGYAAVYQICLPVFAGRPISIRSFIASSIGGHYHMWYMYLLLGIYIALPFLRVLTKKENKNLVLAMIIISSLIQGITPWLAELSGYFKPFGTLRSIINKFDLQYFMGYIVYYLIGWYIYHIGIKSKKLRALIYVGGMIGLLLNILYIALSGSRNISHSPLNILTILYATAIFTFFSRIHISEKRQTIILTFSKLTFGVYMMHPLILEIVFKILPYKNIPWLYLLIWCFVASAISFGVSYVLSKILYIKKLVRV